ncbi:hypothetical protein V6L77_13585 [Pannonibacter sp. Pt2-lr]
MPGLRIEAEALASDLEELNRLKSGIVAEKSGCGQTSPGLRKKSHVWNC